MKLKKYSKYKQSWIDWIWEIPEEWSINRVKHISKIYWRIWYRGYTVNDIVDEWEGALSLSPSNIIANKINLNWSTYISIDKYNESPEIKVFKWDIIFVKTASVWKVWIIENESNEMTLNPQLVVLKKIKLENKYLYYLMISSFFQDQIKLACNWGVMQTITQDAINNFTLSSPKNTFKQKYISTFLDLKTLQIEKLIEKDKNLIELLKEKRVSLINKVVTKGLDDSVKMKDSWVEWIGEIPKGWEVRKLKHLTEFLTCWLASTPEYVDEEKGVPFLSAQNVRPNRMNLLKYNYISHELHKQLTRNRKPKKWDVLVTRVWAWIWEACLVDIDFEFSVYVSVTHIRTNKELLNGFLVYFFWTDYSRFLNSFWTVEGGWQWNLNVKNVETYLLWLPPLLEQQKIVEFLDNETEKIDNHIKKVEKRIELYKEYKKSLIYNVVTGKVEV